MFVSAHSLSCNEMYIEMEATKLDKSFSTNFVSIAGAISKMLQEQNWRIGTQLFSESALGNNDHLEDALEVKTYEVKDKRLYALLKCCGRIGNKTLSILKRYGFMRQERYSTVRNEFKIIIHYEEVNSVFSQKAIALVKAALTPEFPSYETHLQRVAVLFKEK